jgi:hypothetical protein
MDSDEHRHHSDKWHRCWEKVKAKGHDEHVAAAICTAVLEEESYEKSLDDPALLVDAFETVVKTALGPVVARLRTVEPLPARVASLEALAPVPGPQGPPGPAGADGLGFEDASVEHDGERTITIKWARGDAKAERAITIPAMLYRGVYVIGKLYERGDVVTWAGSLWHANAETTTRPGDGAPAWTLAVKRGRDGAR